MIEKAEIERVKRANDLIAIIRSRGVKLVRKGKQLVGLCPSRLLPILGWFYSQELIGREFQRNSKADSHLSTEAELVALVIRYQRLNQAGAFSQFNLRVAPLLAKTSQSASRRFIA
jgi:hypothetical protein